MTQLIMTIWTLIKRSLRFYWRTHLGVVLGVTVSTAILVGALVVGDSVQHSLEALALSRLGRVQLALAPQNRYFRAKLADDLETALDTETAPVLQLRGIAINSDGTARANRVQVLGVDERFWLLGDSNPMFDSGSDNEIVLNDRLAEQLDVREGEEILLRVEKLDLLPRDAPLSTDTDLSIAMRLNVKAIASDSGFGRFSLQANQIAPFNAFVPLVWLQKKVDLPDRANMLLVGRRQSTLSPSIRRDDALSSLTHTKADAALREHWKLADADLELRELPEQGVLELRTGRIFLDLPVASAAKRATPDAVGVLTYFVNELRVDNRSVPYSIVAAIGNSSTLLPPDMSDEDILINKWLADDLRAKPGDLLELTYFVVGSMRKLEERSSRFRIRAVLPMEGPAADRELMPMFPGLSDAENCRDWEPGIPIDLDKIRKKDEEYWDIYRGTPKAFVTLKAGQRMWGNRFGNLTALRYTLKTSKWAGEQRGKSAIRNTQHATRNTQHTRINHKSSIINHQSIEEAIKRELDPASIGLFFQPVREQALAASTQALDFGQLFLGLSFFLIIAALLLMGLLFVFGIESRTEEVGTLLALGFPPYRVRRLLLFEGGVLALLGGFLGTGCGVWYTKVMLYALSTVWRDAMGGGAPLHYYAKPLTLIIGTAAGILVALFAIWVTLRKQARRPAHELLISDIDTSSKFSTASLAKSRLGLWIAIGATVGTLIILGLAGKGRDKGAAIAFFVSGALLLVGGLGLSQALLSVLSCSAGKMRMRLADLGLRNSVRRIGRSLATVALLACGSFLIIAVGANRSNPHEKAERRSSGTGGFALFAESSLPVFHDLNSKEGREAYGLKSNELERVEFISLRVHDGDDASCLNLNRAQMPRLLGIQPEELQTRNAFTFVKMVKDDQWLLLNRKTMTESSRSKKEDDNTVPAIGDEATIVWALGKSIGDTLPYVDERGNTFNIRLVGMLAKSIFQGGLLISEDDFIERFPSESGYRMFLIDAPFVVKKPVPRNEVINRRFIMNWRPENVTEISKTLSRALQDVGLEITSTAQRLAEFNTVQNTYMSIFQLLGGLAMILGSVGLGIVVLRNVMERRSELAILRAVGFEKRSLQWLVLSEHWLLLLLGLVCGVVAGLVAVLPALRSPGVDVPYASLTLTLFAVVFNGALWTWLATILALRGPLLAALRNE